MDAHCATYPPVLRRLIDEVEAEYGEGCLSTLLAFVGGNLASLSEEEARGQLAFWHRMLGKILAN